MMKYLNRVIVYLFLVLSKRKAAEKNKVKQFVRFYVSFDKRKWNIIKFWLQIQLKLLITNHQLSQKLLQKQKFVFFLNRSDNLQATTLNKLQRCFCKKVVLTVAVDIINNIKRYNVKYRL